MSATEYDIHDELIQKECIRLHTHFKDRILQEKDFFELNNAVLKITEYIVKLERENCGLKEKKSPGKSIFNVINHLIIFRKEKQE